MKIRSCLLIAAIATLAIASSASANAVWSRLIGGDGGGCLLEVNGSCQIAKPE
jgi:hypothetical protein